MADKIQPLAEAQDPYVDILRTLKEIAKVQDKELIKAKQFNIENKLLSELKSSHLNDDQKLLTLQTSVLAKTKNVVQLESARRDLLRAGYATTSVEILAINAYLRNMRRETKSAVKEYDALLFKMSTMTALLDIANKTGFEEMLKFSKELRTNWETHPILGLKTVLLKVIDVFNVLDTQAAEFRKQMGLTRTFTAGIDASARQVAFDFAHIGVSAKIAYESVIGISKGLFSSLSATTAMVRDVSILSAQLGISADMSAEFMKNMGIAFRTTAGAQSNMTFFTAKLTEAAGVPLGEIMADISNATKNSYQYISRTGISLVKAAVEAKRMGTSLDGAAKSSQSLLDFTNSVKKEMEASVLVGKSINLQKARELAYHKDIRGLNKEILNIMKETDFENLDPFQQNAVADALGKSAGELANMAQAERERLGWERSTDPVIQEQLRAYKEMMSATESIANQNGKNMRLQLQAKANQAAIASITQSWNAILQRMGEAVLPYIDFVLKGIAKGLGYINTVMGTINAKFGAWGKAFNGLVVLSMLLFGPKLLGKLISWATGGIFKSVGNAIGGMLKGIAGGVSSFGASSVIKGAIGLMILSAAMIPFAYACKLMAGVPWQVIVAAGAAVVALAIAATLLSFAGPEIIIGALAIAILGAAMIPFGYAATLTAKAIKMLADVDMVKIAVGLMALGTATMPLAMITPLLPLMAIGLGGLSFALRLIAGPAERAGQSMLSLGLGLQMTTDSLTQLQNLSLVGTILQIKNLASSIVDLSKAVRAMPDISIEKLKTIALTGGGATEGQKKDTTTDTLQAIKDAIDGLRADFKNGSLTANVFLDSQKLDSAQGRRLLFTGTLA